MVKMKDTGIEWIGEIPENWSLKKFKYNLSVHEIKGYGDKEVLSLYRELGIIPKNSRDDNHNVTSEDTSKYKLVRIGDFAINKMKAWQGSVAVSNYEGIVSPAYYVYEFTNKTINKKYFHHLMRNKRLADEFRRISGGIREGQWDLGRTEFENLYLPFPPIDTQNRIADLLDAKCAKIDSLKNDIEKQIEILEQYKKSEITEAVTKGITSDVKMKDSGIEWIGEIPEHWKTKRAKYIFTPRNDRGNKIELQLLSPTQKYGVIPQALYDEISGMNSVKLKENTDLNLLKTCHKGDYCISLRSFQGGFEYSKYEGVVSPAYQIFYPTIKISDGYYKYLFKEKNFIEKINSFTLSLRDGKPISYFDFSNMYLPLPSAEEQKEIADYLDSKCTAIDNIINSKKQQLEKLEEYKKSLIFEYVTGKREV